MITVGAPLSSLTGVAISVMKAGSINITKTIGVPYIFRTGSMNSKSTSVHIVPLEEFQMKKTVVICICDNCGAEGNPQEGTKIENPLPCAWIRISQTENTEHIEAVDLCGDCKWAFWGALSDRRLGYGK
jgi:hypothetical protein